jgi:hypothetical protein
LNKLLLLVSGVAIGAFGMAVKPTAAPKTILVREPIPVSFCQTFKPEAQQEAEEQDLKRRGYKIVLEQDLNQRAKDYSEGRGDLATQTNRRCFYNLGGEGVTTYEYWYAKKTPVKR